MEILTKINFFLLLLHGGNAIFFNFTKVTCKSLDTNFASVDYCYVKNVTEKSNFVSLQYGLLQEPIRECEVNLKMMIKSTTWKKFLYEVDIDYCKFMKRRYNSIAKWFFDIFQGLTTLNRTCPLHNDVPIRVEPVYNTLASTKMRGIPLSQGPYALFTTWRANNVTRFETNIYVQVIST